MRSEWKRLVWTLAVWMTALAGGMFTKGAEAAEVRNVTAKYLWPWGRVGISYKVVGEMTEGAPLVVSATDRARNTTKYASPSELSGETGTEQGTHWIVWDLNKSWWNLQSSNVTFTITYYDYPLYCVVDLSAGPNASSYPVTYMADPPAGGFNTDEYKTTKLVLRRIDPGTFMMRGKYNARLTRPYYIGLFEMTNKQVDLVCGGNSSGVSGDKRPYACVTWFSAAHYSGGGVMDRLRKRTGLAFNLPTEAQWEYACRAGTTSEYSFDDGEIAGNYMWYKGNSSNQTHDVGSKQPNEWGLYDMHGNVWEWCLDWYKSLLDGPFVDPDGNYTSDVEDVWDQWRRVIRGGSCGCPQYDCSSAVSRGCSPDTWSKGIGYRPAITCQ